MSEMTKIKRTFCPVDGWDVERDEDGCCVHCGSVVFGDGVDALVAEMARIKGETYCAYCGERFPLDAPDASAQIGAHIAVCPKHPMRVVERELAETRATLVHRTEQRNVAEKQWHEAKKALADSARPAIQEFGRRVLLIVQLRMERYELDGERGKAEVVRILFDQLSGLVVP